MAMGGMGSPQGGQKSTVAFPVWDVAKGIIANMSSASIPEGAASYSNNIIYWDSRAVPRPGFSIAPEGIGSTTDGGALNSPETIIHMNSLVGAEAAVSAGVSAYQNLLMCLTSYGGTISMFYFNLFSSSSGGWTALLDFSPPVSPLQNPTSAQFDGFLFIATGTANLQQWNGSALLVDVTNAQTNAALKCPANPFFVTATAERVFIANAIDLDSGARLPQRVWWCDNFNPLIWQANDAGLPEQGASGWQDISSDSSPISGLVFQGSTRVICFKTQSIHCAVYVGGPQWYNFIPITRSRGCGATGSIQAYNDTLIWLGSDYNVYAMDMNNNITALADVIRPLLQKYLNYDFAPAVSSQIDLTLGLYWLSVPLGLEQGAGYNINKIFVLNLHTGAWGECTMSDNKNRYLSASYNVPTSILNNVNAIQLWGDSKGNFYAIDYTQTAMLDGVNSVPFEAVWWGKTRDFLSTLQLGYPGKTPLSQKGEMTSFQKISLHGTVGQARPVVRMGKSLSDVMGSKHLYRFDTMAVGEGDTPVAYVGNLRADPERFGQLGVYWDAGLSDPMALDGLTAWGTPYNQDAR